jgi:hypothetical protein
MGDTKGGAFDVVGSKSTRLADHAVKSKRAEELSGFEALDERYGRYSPSF